jgi:hypothetical protein
MGIPVRIPREKTILIFTAIFKKTVRIIAIVIKIAQARAL